MYLNDCKVRTRYITAADDFQVPCTLSTSTNGDRIIKTGTEAAVASTGGAVINCAITVLYAVSIILLDLLVFNGPLTQSC